MQAKSPTAHRQKTAKPRRSFAGKILRVGGLHLTEGQESGPVTTALNLRHLFVRVGSIRDYAPKAQPRHHINQISYNLSAPEVASELVRGLGPERDGIDYPDLTSVQQFYQNNS
ncbi:MAG TPA: hypothetical protein VHY08_10370, partial [Bacillota bacterium]|nr:hypothetical protein [Bacillota bacterium]